MKVNDRSSLGSLAQGAKANETQRTEKESSSSRVGSSRNHSGEDRVELSTAAGRIASAISAGASDRAGRVSEIAAAYKAGTYKTDSAATSRGLVSEALATGMA